MAAYYIIKERSGLKILARGRWTHYTYNLANAKVFNTEQSARQHLDCLCDRDNLTVVKRFR